MNNITNSINTFIHSNSFHINSKIKKIYGSNTAIKISSFYDMIASGIRDNKSNDDILLSINRILSNNSKKQIRCDEYFSDLHQTKIIPSLQKQDEEFFFLAKEEITNNISLLTDVINKEVFHLQFNSKPWTYESKKSVFEAYLQTLQELPQEVIYNIFYSDDTIFIRDKIFNNFIFLLESKLPLSYDRNGKDNTISSIDDKRLGIFDGFSEFQAVIDENGIIDNLTKEVYIGGKKGSYNRPFYIGKVIDIVCDGKSIIKDMREHSFTYIQMNRALSGKTILVRHLRIPPHHQMGGLALIAKAHKKILEGIDEKMAPQFP